MALFIGIALLVYAIYSMFGAIAAALSVVVCLLMFPFALISDWQWKQKIKKNQELLDERERFMNEYYRVKYEYESEDKD